MKKTTHHILFLAHVLLAAETFAQTVEIGERSVPLAFTNSPAGSFDTNRVSRELTAFFRIADTPEALFRFDMVLPEESKPLRPACPRVPPMAVANDIRYIPPPDERIMVGPTALGALLETFEESASYSNTWAQAEALLSDLTLGTITNDATLLRQAFVLSGGQLIDTAEWDERLTNAVTIDWMTRQVFPFGLLDFRMDRWSEDGPIFPVMIVKFLDTEFPSTGITHDILVFQDGRWRAVLW